MGQCQMRNERYLHLISLISGFQYIVQQITLEIALIMRVLAIKNNNLRSKIKIHILLEMKRHFNQQMKYPMRIGFIDVIFILDILFVTAKNTIVAGTSQQQGNSTALTNTKFPFKLKNGWLTVRSVNKYPLNVNDIFRLGKMTFRISSLSFNSHTESELLNQSKADSNDQCRICLGNTQSSNPLLNPCKCSGFIKYIHLDCMKRWLKEQTQASKQSEKSEIYLWNSLKCEICQEPYKVIFQSDGVTYHMLDLLKPRYPYVMLEFYTKKKENQVVQINLGDHFTQKADGVMVISLGEKMSLGRARENWVRLGEVSVSRFHATLQIEKIQEQDSLFLFDNNSKFGTLVKITEDMPIYQDLEVQVGNSLFKLQTSNITC